MPSRTVKTIVTLTEPQIEKMVVAAKPKSEAPNFFASMEERVKQTVPKEKLQTLFRVDGLTFRQVYEYADSVRFFYFVGDKGLVEEANIWAKDVKLKDIFETVIMDVFINGAGNAWIQLGYSKEGDDILGLKMINPDTEIDFIRDPQTKRVLHEDDGHIKGYVQQKNPFHGKTVEWTRDAITSESKVTWSKTNAKDDGRDRVAHIKLFSLGDEYLGQSPLESTYKQGIIRLNIEDNVGEGAFRSGGIVAYVGEPNKAPVADKIVEDVVAQLQSVNSNSIFGFRHDVKLGPMPSPDLDDKAELIYVFADLQSCGLGIPLTLLLDPPGSRERGEQELRDIKFEYRKMAVLDRLAEQTKEKLLFRMFKARSKVERLSEVPDVKFLVRSPALDRERSRALATLARRDIIIRDPELEMHLREQYELPTTYVERELKIWEEDETKIPVPPQTPRPFNNQPPLRPPASGQQTAE